MPSELKDRIAEALAESGKSKAELARYCQVAAHVQVPALLKKQTYERLQKKARTYFFLFFLLFLYP